MAQRVQLPGLGQPLSRVVLGTMIIDKNRQDDSSALLDAALARGINVLDTANVYAGGNSERGIGVWMKSRGCRDQVVILTKGCHHNPDRQRVTPFDIGTDLHDSLARLQTDYVDIYMLHRDNPDYPVGPIVEALNAYHREGKIRAFGGSNWTHERLQQANDYAAAHGLVPFTVSSPNYGLALQVDNPWGPGCVTVAGPEHAAARAWYARTRTALFAYSSLARGLFSGRVTRENYKETADGAAQRAYCHEVNFQRLDRARELAARKGVTVTQIALAYVLHGEMLTFALVGAQNPAEIAECVAAQELHFTPAELAYLETGKA
jgi:aryl-alcohol dehydrogenase-like predicted oxidoreductase